MTRTANQLLVNLALLLGVMTAVPLPAADNTYSAAEQKLFLDNHLKNIKQSATLTYDYRKLGSLEEGFQDKVLLAVKTKAGSKDKSVDVTYLSGDRRLSLPATESAEGNPVILYFLEKDVRDMHRRTGGQESYFRKRIRMAFAEAADVRAVTLKLGGRNITGTEVRIQPYLDDPMKARFQKFEKKAYVFTLSDEVPGGVYQLRSRVDDPGAAAAGSEAQNAPLMEEILTFSKQGE